MTSGQTINDNRLSIMTEGHCSPSFQRGSKNESCWFRLERRDCVSHAGGFRPPQEEGLVSAESAAPGRGGETGHQTGNNS